MHRIFYKGCRIKYLVAWENSVTALHMVPSGSAGYYARSVRTMIEETVKRGDIFYADLSPVVGSEQGGTRPVLIVQNDTGNRHSPTVIAAAITSQTGKARLPTHINIAGGSVGLSKDSIILLEQIRTIDKRRLREHMGHLDEQQMALVDDAIAVSFGLPGVGRGT